MPFERPSLPTIINRISSDIESRLPGADARLRRQVLTVLGRAQAGAVHGLYGYLVWVAEQILPDLADEEMLARHAAIWDVPRKQPAQAGGDVVFTGTTGTVIAAGTLLTRSDGVEFATDAEATLAAGTITAAVTAVEAGEDGNTEAASTLTLVNPIAGCDSSATVDTGGLTGGTDIEDVEDWRGRVIARIQNPPHGGKASDYELWAMEVAGVTRVWVEPLYLGEGTVGVFFVCDDLDPIIPDAAKVSDVQDYIDALRPVTAQVTVMAPTAVEVDFTIAVTPATDAVKTAIIAELADLILRDGEPGGTIYLSQINEAISVAAGETDHTLTVPAANVAMAAGELAVMGTITWA